MSATGMQFLDVSDLDEAEINRVNKILKEDLSLFVAESIQPVKSNNNNNDVSNHLVDNGDTQVVQSNRNRSRSQQNNNNNNHPHHHQHHNNNSNKNQNHHATAENRVIAGNNVYGGNPEMNGNAQAYSQQQQQQQHPQGQQQHPRLHHPGQYLVSGYPNPRLPNAYPAPHSNSSYMLNSPTHNNCDIKPEYGNPNQMYPGYPQCGPAMPEHFNQPQMSHYPLQFPTQYVLAFQSNPAYYYQNGGFYHPSMNNGIPYTYAEHPQQMSPGTVIYSQTNPQPTEFNHPVAPAETPPLSNLSDSPFTNASASHLPLDDNTPINSDAEIDVEYVSDSQEPEQVEQFEESVQNVSDGDKTEEVQNHVDAIEEKPEQEEQSTIVENEQKLVEEQPAVPPTSPKPTVTVPAASSWASLFNKSMPSTNNKSEVLVVQSKDEKSVVSSMKITPVQQVSTTSVRPDVVNNNKHESNQKQSNAIQSASGKFNKNSVNNTTPVKKVSPDNDKIALKIAQRVKNYKLLHGIPSIVPCGLINRGNYCYINAVLQALLASPPFYNLMRDICSIPGLLRPETSTPILDSFAQFFTRFPPQPTLKSSIKNAQQNKNIGTYLENLLGNSFEPIFIKQALKFIGMNNEQGLQEDAEELLSNVLNGLNDEFIALSKHFFVSEDELTSAPPCKEDSSEDALWKEVSTRGKNKSIPTRAATVVSTPIADIFQGMTLDVRTITTKSKEPIVQNRQPFFTFQVDIKAPTIKSLEDALRLRTQSEPIDGYICNQTKQLVPASSQTFLETLPPLLVLHLKIFDYDPASNICSKIIKRISFDESFEIPKECVSRNNRGPRKFKLLAVVSHRGPDAQKGHYFTDVYHLGLNRWLRCDDGALSATELNQVLKGGEGNDVPYLLFYRRVDTLSRENFNNNDPSQMGSQNFATQNRYRH